MILCRLLNSLKNKAEGWAPSRTATKCVELFGDLEKCFNDMMWKVEAYMRE